jgi:hypothetical protein
MSIEEQQLAAEMATETQVEATNDAGESTAPETVETDEEKNKRVTDEANEAARKKEEKRQQSVQKRIDELTADKYAERKRADELAAQNAKILAMMEERQQKPNPKSDAPQREQFDSYEDYLRAEAKHEARQEAEAATKRAIDEFSKSQKETQSIAAYENERKTMERQFIERRTEVEKKYPDYNAVIEDWEPQLPDSVVDLMVRLPEGPLLSYHMAKNPGLEAQFREQPQHMHGVLLGQILATLKSSTAETKAPPPGKPVSPKAVANDGGYSGDPEGYYAWAVAQQKAGKLR